MSICSQLRTIIYVLISIESDFLHEQTTFLSKESRKAPNLPAEGSKLSHHPHEVYLPGPHEPLEALPLVLEGHPTPAHHLDLVVD